MAEISGVSKPIIEQMVAHIFASRQIKRQEHLYMTSIILSNREITIEERRQINRVFDHLLIGRLKLTD